MIEPLKTPEGSYIYRKMYEKVTCDPDRGRTLSLYVKCYTHAIPTRLKKYFTSIYYISYFYNLFVFPLTCDFCKAIIINAIYVNLQGHISSAIQDSANMQPYHINNQNINCHD